MKGIVYVTSGENHKPGCNIPADPIGFFHQSNENENVGAFLSKDAHMVSDGRRILGAATFALP